MSSPENSRFRFHPDERSDADYKPHIPDTHLKEVEIRLEEDRGNVESHVPPEFLDEHSQLPQDAPPRVRSHIEAGGDIPSFGKTIIESIKTEENEEK